MSFDTSYRANPIAIPPQGRPMTSSASSFPSGPSLLPIGLHLHHDVTGSHHGQLDGEIIVQTRTGDQLGHLVYAVFREALFLQWIWVDPEWRRQGLATAMLTALHTEHPSGRINWGATTADGTALRHAWDRPRPSSSHQQTADPPPQPTP